MVPFLDLKRQYREIQDEVNAAVMGVLESCQFILGPEVAAFEEEFANYCRVRHAVGCNSGTSALHLALLAAGIGAGDEVITVPFTFVATAGAIRYTGARPVFVDIDQATFNMDPARIEAAITPKTKAIVPVHLFGQCADMGPMVELARRRGLVVIEDAAQAHGAEYHGWRAGSIGDLGCFSFYPGKNLGAYGEGGIVTTANPEYARRIRMLRDWGAEQRYHYVMQGYNYRLDSVQAAVLRVKLRYLDRWTEARRANARRYRELLGGCGVALPVESPGNRHVWAVYAMQSENRDGLQKALTDSGIGTAVYYPIPIHLSEAHHDLGHKRGDFPNSERASRRQLSLPVFPELTGAEIEEVAGRVRSFEPGIAGAP
jgi:dTDP-4-amino-4,6-dideoxygalactose transaminase